MTISKCPGSRWGLTTALALALALTACVPPPGRTPTSAPNQRPAAKSAPRPKPSDARIIEAGVATQLRGRLSLYLGEDAPAVISNQDSTLISDRGAGFISDQGGGFISDQGGGIISDQGGGIISNHGGNLIQRARLVDGTGQLIQRARLVDSAGNLIQRARFALAQAAGQTSLAGARVDVLDAAGQVLTDAAGQPLGGVSDAEGNFAFNAPLPDRVAILRARLFLGSAPDRETGALYALVVRPKKGEIRRDLDLASSWSARIVLESFVAGQQSVLDRLPAANVAALDTAMGAASGQVPDDQIAYGAPGLASAAATLAAEAPAVREELDRIRAILLAGTPGLGNGRQATDVSLVLPIALADDGAGGFWVAEQTTGRLRHVDATGQVTVRKPGERDLLTLTAMIRLDDGALLVADGLVGVVRRIAPDGTSAVIAGGGAQSEPGGGPATEASLTYPAALARHPDGSVYIGEAPRAAGEAGRLLRLAPDGTLHRVAPPPSSWNKPLVTGLACAPDGSLYVVDPSDGCLHRRDPAGVWSIASTDIPFGRLGGVAVDGAGTVYVSNSANHAIRRLVGSRLEPLAGSGRAGYAAAGTIASQADLNEPAGLCLRPDGTLAFAERGNGLVRAFDPQDPAAPLRTLAGAFGATQVGTASALSLSSPFGLAIDDEGRIVASEAGAHTLKRLDGMSLTPLAGSTRGKAQEDVDAAAATFDVPAGLAYDGRVLYVIDSDNHCLRRIDEAGRVTIVAGGGLGRPEDPVPAVMPAREMALHRGLGLAVGPDHMPYVADNQAHRIWRIRPDGMAEVVAGLTSGRNGGYGEDGPAQSASLRLPVGLAFGPDGDLYLAEAGNLVVRKISGLAGPTPTIAHVAGLPLLELLARRATGEIVDVDGMPAKDAPLYGPGAIAFDAQGNLYVAELGNAEIYTLLPSLGDTVKRVGARIRLIAPDGTIRTVAGEGGPRMGDPTADDFLVNPIGLAVDRGGALVIADSGTNLIWRLPPIP